MSAPLKEWLRPSALPKLALCGQYRGDPVSSEAAERGTKLDIVFRKLIAKENVDVSELDAEERCAVKWAENTALLLAGDNALDSREENLRVEVMGMTGTADLLCAEGRWSADLKTGLVRNYVEQQAAYALGFMDQYFCDEWTVYLLFCDVPQNDVLMFTREDAEAILRTVLAKAVDDAPATPNEYCGWCARRFDCAARKESLGLVPLEGAANIDLATAPSPTLRDFVLAAKVIEDFVERARAILLERILAGETVPGVSKVNGRTTRIFNAVDLSPLVTALGPEKVLAAFGSLSEAKTKALWDETAMPWPSEKLITAHAAAHVMVRRPKC